MKTDEFTCCNVCGGSVEPVVDLPKFPLTGLYSREGPQAGLEGHDQCLLVCARCGHGQLRFVLDERVLYGSTYAFRTSSSQTASEGSRFFAAFLDRCFPGHRWKRVLEFGCNDTFLLHLLSTRADRLLGVDPILEGHEAEYGTGNIQVYGDCIEAVDYVGALGGIPDLVVSQHTLEHLRNARDVLSSLMEKADHRTVFVMEFPGFDWLLENYRFDQVFHQHLQYFSMQSISALLDQLGSEILFHEFNHHYWGASLIAFRKKRQSSADTPVAVLPYPRTMGAKEVRRRYQLFKTSMSLTGEMLQAAKPDPLYGYGAALMLPVLGYHLETDFSDFARILDDDPGKDGLGYANLPVRIGLPRDVAYSESTFLLTAMDNRRPILRSLIDKKPKRIINPLGLL